MTSGMIVIQVQNTKMINGKFDSKIDLVSDLDSEVVPGEHVASTVAESDVTEGGADLTEKVLAPLRVILLLLKH